jgi:hypothetical protein
MPLNELKGVVNGILTYVGLAGIFPGEGNQFVDRVVLLLTHPSEHPQDMPYATRILRICLHFFGLLAREI